MKSLSWLFTLSVLTALVLAGCTVPRFAAQEPDESQPLQTMSPVPADEDTGTLRVIAYRDTWSEFEPLDTGLSLAVAEGQGSATGTAFTPAEVTRLPETEALVLLDRVPALQGREAPAAPLLPTARLNPPPAGTQEILPFPPVVTAPDPDVPADPLAALQVLRYSPSEDTAVVPNVSVTFSQPMVALTSHAVLAETDFPVALSPTPPGEWYWMGTRTVVFQPEGRLPGATRYRVEIPPGLQAVAGSTLETGVSWEFETERLALAQTWPPDVPQPVRPHVALEFNQAIDPLALESYISLHASGREIPYAVLKPDLHALPTALQAFLTRTVPARTLVLQPLEDLAPNTTLRVDVAPGAPSAEGPLPTQATQSMSLRTFGPLQIRYASCRNRQEACEPGEGFFIEFNHDLDPDSLTAAMVSIDPPLPEGTVTVFPWGSMMIEGDTAPNTVYRLWLQPGLRDEFGQTFRDPQEVLFHVREQTPSLHYPPPMQILDARNEGLYTLYSRNLSRLRVILYQVEPEDWKQFLALYNMYEERDPARYLDRAPVLDTSLALEASATGMTRTVLDLNPYLQDGQGHLILVLVPPRSLIETLFRRHRDHALTWIQATALGLDAYADQESLVVHATSLATGEPLANVDLQLLPQQSTATTDASGHAVFALPGGQVGNDPLLVAARHGQDRAFLPQAFYMDEEAHWAWPRDRIHHQWHVFTDRNLYQPGEEVQIKGWVRQVEFAPDGDVTWPRSRQARISYRIYDQRGVELEQGTVQLNANGALNFTFTVPANANSGSAYVQFELSGLSGWSPGQYHELDFRIEEFRRSEFEVAVTTDPDHRFLDEELTVSAQAQYYGGGPLQGTDVTWEVMGRTADYAPPGWDRFHFGLIPVTPWRWVPWEEEPGVGSQASLSSQLDARGRHSLAVTASASLLPAPHTLQVEATVQDLSQQTFTGSALLMVHPSSLYVGGRTDSYLAEAAKLYPVEIIVTDVDGTPIPSREVRIQAYPDPDIGMPTVSLAQEQDIPNPECLLQSAVTSVTCDLVFPESGHWWIDISVLDAQGRANLTRLTRWVLDDGVTIVPGTSSGLVEMTPDRDEYQPGDVAEILIQPPFLPAYGTVITNRAGMVTHTPVEIAQAQYVLSLPIEESHIPNLHVSVLLAGQAPDPVLGEILVPAMARGDLNLRIPPYVRELHLDLHMADADLQPGGEAAVTVQVTDHAGLPVPDAEVVLLAVDEAILALTGYQFVHPLDSFYPDRFLELYTYHLRHYMQSAAVDLQGVGRGGGLLRAESAAMEMEEGAMAPMAAMATEGESMAMADMVADDSAESAGRDFAVRTDFNPLAFFEPAGTTDQDGMFRGTWNLPDTVGRYRVIALSTSGPHLYGLTETSYTTRLPVQIRPQWPRFLNFGDVAAMSVLVENQTREEQALTLVVQSDGLDLAYQAADRALDALTFTLPAQSRQQILIPATARDTGENQLLVSVFNEQVQDAALGSFPIYVPASQEGFAAYGIVEDTIAVQGFQLPADVHRNFGQLTISTSSTVLQSLLDSYQVLVDTRGWDYPERLASRLLANIALRDVLYAFNQPELPVPAALDRHIQADVDALVRLQRPNGGFPLWDVRDPAWPFVSVHSMHALAVARHNGYAVSAEAMQAGLLYLATIERHYPDYFQPATRRYITAYALYVRSLLGDVDLQAAERLLGSVPRDSLSLEVVAWCLLVMHRDATAQDRVAEWMEFILNRVNETTGKASFTREAVEQDGYLILHSAHRSDALLLQALMAIQPESDLVIKVVNGLLAARDRYGHWGSSQGNIFVLQALNRYFRQYEAVVPDFTARAWLDETLVLNAPFQERETAIRHISLPMPWLFAEEPERIRIQRDGQGRLYYRLGLDYVPADLQLAPRERGFTVLRTYTGVDDPADVWQDPDGTWHVRLGARVRIDVTLVAPGTRHHVLLASPLPAGLELVNTALEGSRSFSDPNRSSWYYWYWFDHQQLLDERAQAVTTWLPAGVYQYGVVAEATTAGTFQVPPPRAAEIYAPETFGYGASEVVVVEPD